MVASLNQDFTMFQGDISTVEFTVKDAAGVVVDISGGTLTWAFAKSLKFTPIVTKIAGSGLTIVDGPNGRVDVSLVLGDTDTLLGLFEHELVLNGTTVAAGAITILASTIK